MSPRRRVIVADRWDDERYETIAWAVGSRRADDAFLLAERLGRPEVVDAAVAAARLHLDDHAAFDEWLAAVGSAET